MFVWLSLGLWEEGGTKQKSISTATKTWLDHHITNTKEPTGLSSEFLTTIFFEAGTKASEPFPPNLQEF